MSDAGAAAWMMAAMFGSGAAVLMTRIICDYLFDRRRLELEHAKEQR